MALDMLKYDSSHVSLWSKYRALKLPRQYQEALVPNLPVWEPHKEGVGDEQPRKNVRKKHISVIR